MNFFDQNSALAISGILAKYAFRKLTAVGAHRNDNSEFQGQNLSFESQGYTGGRISLFLHTGLHVLLSLSRQKLFIYPTYETDSILINN